MPQISVAKLIKSIADEILVHFVETLRYKQDLIVFEVALCQPANFMVF